MPLIEYRCHRCNQTFEVIQKFSDPDRTECSVCGGPLERLLSAPAIQFKGSGWYVNDYARKSSNGTSKRSTTTGSDSSAASSTTGSSESKSSSVSEQKD